jgi:transcriptional regulator NrdR family protein
LAYIMFICHTFVPYNGGNIINPIMKTLLLIDKLSKEQLETLLAGEPVTCEDQVLALDSFMEDGEFKEPYRTALVLKVLGKTTGALLCALSLIDCEGGTYGRRIGQELEKDDNYIRQLLNIMELMGILKSSEGKGKQKIFTVQEDLIILPRDQLARVVEGHPVSIELLISRELEKGTVCLEDLFCTLYDDTINQIVQSDEKKERFEVGQLIESLIKSGVVRTFETSSSKRLTQEGFLTFYQLLDLLKTVKEKIPRDQQNNVKSADLTRVIEEELHHRDETGELARRYRNYVQYRMRKQIVTVEGTASIDFATLKNRIDKMADQKGLHLSSNMRNVLAENLITSLKGLPITSFKDTFIESFIDNLLEDKFLITSSEDMMNKAETLLRVGTRLLENARDIQDLDAAKSREFTAEASLNILSLLLLLQGESPPQKLFLMNKAFLKKKGNGSVFASLVEDFSSLRKNKEMREKEEFLEVERTLKEQYEAFDMGRFLITYLKMVSGEPAEEFSLEQFVGATDVLQLISGLLYEFRMKQMEG